MGRSPPCAKGVNKGAWSLQEDQILVNFIQTHGQGKWRSLPQKAGLKRCGKSCRLRWLNYLRPDIKRGDISADEEDLIIRLHSLLGNRWALIAKRLPGRTDNEIKNYWKTNLDKKFHGKKSKLPMNPKPAEDKNPIEKPKMKTQSKSVNQSETSIPPQEFRLSTSQNENLVPVDDDSFNFLMEINVDQMNFHMSNINHVTGEENDLSPSEDDNVHEHEMKCVLSSELKRVASFLELEDHE